MVFSVHKIISFSGKFISMEFITYFPVASPKKAGETQ